ncbi:MAG: cell division protein FtsZ [Rhodospirillales bacterium]|nr:cell division protein FtsZ [Alphaproteobacteria bacterium]MCB1839064.1 cell division protein FtsZ [Alphaproteobacteria bacterium]MCB9976379.1 cell division protein FtsZ [Rhodospirillales bacterium]
MINIKIKPSELHALAPKIAVIGVGGAGGNAVNNMISSNLEGCEFIVCNTDAQALQGCLAENRVQLGVNITGGLGAGSKPEVGQAAAEESLEEVMQYLEGANMAFITAGMGGGTGTGAAPVIAKACRQQGILTVGVVTKPFHFEGVHRMDQAERGIEEMQGYVDTLIVIPNQNLFRIANEKTTFAEAFRMADSVLQSGVRGVTDLMVRPGLVNLDFADIRTAMLQMGKAMMGTGEATGEKRAIQAAEAAINNPLLDEVSMKGAHGVIINVTGGYDMTLFEADEACNRIRDEVDPGANIIFGATFDEGMEGTMRVSIVATGIDKEARKNKIFGGSGKSGGGVKLPDQGAAAPLERTQPKAESSTAVQQARDSAISALTGKEAVKSLKAPVSIASKKYAQPMQEPHQEHVPVGNEPYELYEQAEFPVAATGSGQGEVGFASNTVLRGATYRDSFIPPKPVEVDYAGLEGPAGPHISSFHGAHISGQEITETGTAQDIKAATSRVQAGKAKRSPSLFERITGSVQQRLDSLREEETDEKPQGRFAAQPKSPISGEPSQGSLNISAPAKKPGSKIDDELDIPAFLRRQAN